MLLSAIRVIEHSQKRLSNPSRTLQPHFATKHAIHKNEVAESEAHPQPPPNEPHAHPILAWGGIVDGDVACGIAPGRQQAGMEPRSHTRQHTYDICARTQK